MCVGLRRSGTTSQKRQMDLNLSPPPRLRYPCRPAEMCAWKRAGPRAIILPLIFLFEIKPQREHMRESEEGQKTRLWITSSEGGGSLQQQNCPIGEALPLSQTESFCPTVISLRQFEAWMFCEANNNRNNHKQQETICSKHISTHPTLCLISSPCFPPPLISLWKIKVPALANLSIRMLSCCGDDGGLRRPTIHVQRLVGSERLDD